MRKARGRWQWVEYDLRGGRYGVLAQGLALHVVPHAGARRRLGVHEALKGTTGDVPFANGRGSRPRRS